MTQKKQKTHPAQDGHANALAYVEEHGVKSAEWKLERVKRGLTTIRRGPRRKATLAIIQGLKDGIAAKTTGKAVAA